MTVVVRVSKSFKVAVKPLLKRYPSLQKDLLALEAELVSNPSMGTPLGNNAYKIRLKISSKGKGKSGGARIISLLEGRLLALVDAGHEDVIVTLIMIYDKSSTGSITDKELKDLIKSFYRNG